MPVTPKPVRRPRKPRVSKSPVNTALAEYMVPKEILTRYHDREIGGVTGFNIFKKYYELRRHLMLEGFTSSGKTMAVEAFSAFMGLPLFTISGAGGTTESDLFGRNVPTVHTDGSERLAWADGPVTLAAKYGGILYVNEGNFIPPEVSSLLYSLTDYRSKVVIRGAATEYQNPNNGNTEYRELVIEAHESLWVVVDGNPGYAGTGDWNQAFRNRFSVITWDYDIEVESNLIHSQALRDFMTVLRRSLASGDLMSAVTTKQFMDFQSNIYELGLDFAIHVLLSYFYSEERELVMSQLKDNFLSKIMEEYEITEIEVSDDDYSDEDVVLDSEFDGEPF